MVCTVCVKNTVIHLVASYDMFINRPYHTVGARVIVISGSLIWSKTLMELIFNPCGEFREVRRAQLAKSTPQLLVSALGSFKIF